MLHPQDVPAFGFETMVNVDLPYNVKFKMLAGAGKATSTKPGAMWHQGGCGAELFRDFALCHIPSHFIYIIDCGSLH